MARALLLSLCAIIITAQHVVLARDLLEQSCMSLAGDAASGPCQDFVQLQSKFPGDNPTDAQIQSVLNANGRPSPSCCTSAGELVTRHCQCDASVQQYSVLYGLTPSSLVTFARAAKLACGSPYIANNVSPYCSSPGAAPGASG